MPRSTVTSKGQVTIPKAIRERLGLAVGDTLEFTVDEEGRIVARPDEVGEGVLGILRDLAPDHPLSIEQINEAARRGAVRADNGRGE
jgi:AbrB family looped-hinge helix DNA binding protein